MFEDQFIEGFGFVQWQFQFEFVVEVVQGVGIVDYGCVFFVLVCGMVVVGCVGGEFFDQFFNDVFQGYEIEQFVVFIYYQVKVLVVVVEEFELVVKWGVGWNVVGFDYYVVQFVVGELIVEGGIDQVL